ncbi:hypothetical protein [Natrinema thermotolerans]|uniref:hypothetical protein n=1 Tax=Natrinema thermotolerans TaxID=121872 RepID=UPI000678F371|nr:hypothetical protein [Natrinema thermotolerans]QCC57293.1 hypothetical protein DVR14_01045 [Natrinema thermotolerans]
MFDISSERDERRDRTEKWPPERIDAEIREYQRAKATVSVTDLMDTNAGDENHREENWWACPNCDADVPIDYDECWRCGR